MSTNLQSEPPTWPERGIIPRRAETQRGDGCVNEVPEGLPWGLIKSPLNFIPAMQTVNLYVLCEPDTGEIRYVGMSKNPVDRLSRHVKEAQRGHSTHRKSWIRGLLSRGLRPRLELLFEIPELLWQEYERAYIRIFRDAGCRLVNGTDGGEGVVNPSPETRRKRNSSNTGKKRTKEFCEFCRKIKLGQKPWSGRKHSLESREKMRRARLGTCASLETREKMSRSRLGKKQSPETVAKRQEARRANRA